MNDHDLHNQWAWSQIEAAADGSLQGTERRRMHAALKADPALRAAVARAAAVHRALRAGAVPVPRGLVARLLSIGATERSARRRLTSPAWLAAAALAGLAVWRATAPPPPDPHGEAVEEFVTAMNYLQRSAARTGNEVAGSVTASVHQVLVASRESLRGRSNETDNGG